jgi:signal peptidase I
MEPTLDCAGDLGCSKLRPDLIRAARLSEHDALKRGDIVVLARSHRLRCGPGHLIIKRVIALPGETIAQRHGVVRIDGRPLTESYTQVSPTHLRDFGAVRLEAGSYFVMGDNRAIACDSRDFGPVRRAQIVARVVAIARSE